MTKIRFHSAAAVAACALFAFALPANATNTNSNSRPAPEATQQAENSSEAENSDQRRICVRLRQGVSRISRPVCKTAEEWETAGGVPAEER